MKPTRESVIAALFTKLTMLVPDAVVTFAPDDPTIPVQAVSDGALTSTKPLRTLGRRVRTFEQSGPKPAIYIGEFGNVYKWSSESLGTVTLEPALFIYIEDGSDGSKIPSITMNHILDALDLALAPDDLNGKCTLGGLVSSCRADGEVPIAPGDLGGPGVAVLPLNILVANGDLS